MKKLFCTALFGLFVGGAFAQTPQIPEPDFIGEVVTVLPDGKTSKLEKETVLLRTRANASAQIFGIGKAKTKLIIDTPEAAVRLKGDDDIRFIVKAVDNATDRSQSSTFFGSKPTKRNALPNSPRSALSAV